MVRGRLITRGLKMPCGPMHALACELEAGRENGPGKDVAADGDFPVEEGECGEADLVVAALIESGHQDPSKPRNAGSIACADGPACA